MGWDIARHVRKGEGEEKKVKRSPSFYIFFYFFTSQVKKTLTALGLHKLNHFMIHKNTPAINGMLRTVLHCVDIKVCEFKYIFIIVCM